MVGIEFEEIQVRYLECVLSFRKNETLVNTCFRAETQKYWIKSGILLRFHICCTKEARLLEVNSAIFLILRDGYNRKSNFLRPDVHNTSNIYSTSLGESSPQVT